MNTACSHINRTKILRRIYKAVCYFLYTSNILQTIFTKHLRCDIHHSYLISHDSFMHKMLTFIIIKHLFDNAEAWGHPHAEAWVDARFARICLQLRFGVSFKSHKVSLRDNIINRSNHLHVCIKVNSTIFIKHPKSSIITHKGIFLRLICLSSIRNDIHIKIILIPLLYFIIWQILLPRSNALLC